MRSYGGRNVFVAHTENFSAIISVVGENIMLDLAKLCYIEFPSSIQNEHSPCRIKSH